MLVSTVHLVSRNDPAYFASVGIVIHIVFVPKTYGSPTKRTPKTVKVDHHFDFHHKIRELFVLGKETESSIVVSIRVSRTKPLPRQVCKFMMDFHDTEQ